MKKRSFLCLIALLLCLAMLLCACGGKAPNTDGSTPNNPATGGESGGETVVTYKDFDEDAIVLTFAAMSDVHNASSARASKQTNMMKRLASLYRLDAFVFAGDLADKINGAGSKYNEAAFKQGYNELINFAEGAVRGNEDELPILWCMGNHETPDSAYTGKISFWRSEKLYSFENSTMLDAAYTIFEKNDPDGTMFMKATEGAPTGFRSYELYTHMFFAVDYRYATEESVVWLDEQLTACEKQKPQTPIFVISHMPSTHNAQPDVLTKVLEKHPRVIYISGHSHIPMQNYTAIRERNGFAEVNLGPANHGSYGVSGSGYSYNSYSMKQAAIFEVDINGNVRVTALDLSFHVEEDGEIKELITQKGHANQYTIAEDPLVIRTSLFSRPSDNGAFSVTEDSVVGSVEDSAYFSPVFSEDAILSVSDPTVQSVNLSIGKADATNLIKYYKISVTDADGNTVLVYDPLKKSNVETLSIGSDYIMYGIYDNYPKTYSYALRAAVDADGNSGFIAGESYTVSVIAVDDFGKPSNAITATFTVE